jgi:hypothetical protein
MSGLESPPQKPDSEYSRILEYEAVCLVDRYRVQGKPAASMFRVERNVCTY